MKPSLVSTAAISVLFLSCFSEVQAAPTHGLAVGTEPSKSYNQPYKTFAPYELGLRLPKTVKPNTAYKSVPFYAVVLKVVPTTAEVACDGGEYSLAHEAERKRVQKLFPNRKVFADQQCPDMGAVGYIRDGNTNNRPFIAVYGGATAKAAVPILQKVKRQYPKATIQRMQVVFEQIMQ